MPSPNYQNPSGVQVQPPGVSGGVAPMLPPQMVHYQVPPGQPPRPYPPPMPNGYPAVPAGTMPHPGGLFHLLVFVNAHFDCQILVLL
jgi:hypothetical protein